MARFLRTKSLYYDDVNLIASKGNVESRKDVPVEIYRIMVAPMASISGPTFVHTACEIGVSIILHRFCNIEEQVNLFKEVKSKSEHVWCAIGIKEPERVETLIKAGCRKILIDVANGYSSVTLNYLKQFLESYEVQNVMSGNIHSASGYGAIDTILQRTSSKSLIRVGIGNGAACLTSKEVTGFGRGQISELLECYEYQTENGSSSQIIADGGIKNAADASKAFGCGAEYVMMGSYFSQAKEAQTHIQGDGTYWGGASLKQQGMFGGVKRHAEGTVLEIKSELEPLEQLVDSFWMGLASAVSYSGKNTLSDFIGNGVFEIKMRK